MKFDKIDNLSYEDVTVLYNDIIEFGDDIITDNGSYIDECCVETYKGASGSNTECTYYRYMTNSECIYWSKNWCRNKRMGFSGSTNTGYQYAHYYVCK